MPDDIFLPDEEDPEFASPFQKSEIHNEHRDNAHVPIHGMNASSYVKVTFDRFVALVANQNFTDVIEANRDEEIIISTNLLTDLANSRRFVPNTKVPLMILGGALFGILIGYFIFNGV